ncbi:hypothetical protein TRVL_07781 [Trypanosoma vivax]|nr:hypothetical protein TRVL_07781 [Trypanosoma vivax]
MYAEESVRASTEVEEPRAPDPGDYPETNVGVDLSDWTSADRAVANDTLATSDSSGRETSVVVDGINRHTNIIMWALDIGLSLMFLVAVLLFSVHRRRAGEDITPLDDALLNSHSFQSLSHSFIK